MRELEKLIIKHEGLRLKPYKCTAGKTTIGVGHNLDDNGISEDAAMFIFREDLAKITGELFRAFPFIDGLSPVRQAALVNMAFNLGLPRFSRFEKMLAALQADDFITAGREMLDSKWARQVGLRADELAFMIKNNKYIGD